MYLIDLCIRPFLHALGIFRHLQLLDDGVEVALNDGLQWEVLVLPFEAVVGDAVLRVVVGTDFTRPVARANERFPLGGLL